MMKLEINNKTERGLNALALAGFGRLSIIESYVLQKFLGGLSEPRIAEVVGCTEETIDHHLCSIRKKLIVDNDVELVLACVWLGFVEPGLKVLPNRKAA